MTGPLRVAIVGAGAAGAYAADQLLRRHSDVEVEMFERLPTPWGLIRTGVAPDHQRTKQVTETFAWMAGREGFRFHLGVEVGRDVSIAELRSLHHAVIVAAGAAGSRRLGIPGEDLPGSLAATEFVAWYNGHPEGTGLEPDLTGERAVVIGNGNVALDVARILTMDPEALAHTDIADYALAALRASRVREVIVLGRRGPAQAAFTTAELIGLRNLDGVDVVVERAGVLDDVEPPAASDARSYATRQKLRVLREIAQAQAGDAPRRIVLRFFGAPVEIIGARSVEALNVARTALVPSDDGGVALEVAEEVEQVDTGLVLRSIGYRAAPIEGVPFDDARAVIPHDAGRVAGEPGLYVAGWIKRGPTGVIGTNKHCALETVEALLADHAAGVLRDPVAGAEEVARLVATRCPQAFGLRGWQAIDRRERRDGEAASRPRIKLVNVEGLVAEARRAAEEAAHVA